MPPPPPPPPLRSARARAHSGPAHSGPAHGGPAHGGPAHGARADLRYYSEPDASNYFEIDYEFLKELRNIARNNCPKCKRKRSRGARRNGTDLRPRRRKEYVYCDGKYHGQREHCRGCCRVCGSDTPTSHDEDSRGHSKPSVSVASSGSRSDSTSRARERKNSLQSNKSVSFLESSAEEAKDEPNYTAKSFTNDLKKFLLKPATPRRSLRDKFITSFKQEFDATRKSPKLKSIKGLWKSY